MISQIRQNCTFEKYSESSGNKIVLPSPLNKRSGFCICSFMQKIYVIDGCRKFEEEDFYSTIASYMCYDIKSNKCSYIASVKTCRDSAWCAVFEDKTEVTGSYCSRVKKLKFVESFCFHENKWT